MFVLLVMLFLSCGSHSTFAQNDNAITSTEKAGGTLYYIAFPDTVTNTYDARYPHQLLNSRSLTLMIYSPVVQRVRIGRANGAKEEIHISAGQIVEFDTESIGMPLIAAVNQPQTNVLQVEAEFPVIVYAYMGTAFGMAAFTPIAVESWGQEYYAATWPGEIVQDVFPNGESNYRTETKEAPNEILVIAAYDNTQVSIQPTSPLRECRGCQNVRLDAGQAYLVQSIVDTSSDVDARNDLAGTQITANKRIGVLSGNTRVMHSSDTAHAENSAKDLVAEWLTPVGQHGTEFVFTPTWDDRRQRDGLDPAESRECELVRVYGTANDKTEVSWLNELGQSTPDSHAEVQSKEFVQQKICSPAAKVYRSNQPAYAVMSPESVMNFNGEGSWPNALGTLFSSWSTYMVELVPRERWTSFAPFRASNWPPAGMNHYLNVVTDSASQNNVYIWQEGTPRTRFDFNQGKVPGTDLVWGAIPINAGISYFLEGDNGATFTGHVYGMLSGNEQFRPHGTWKDDDGKEASLNGSGQSTVPGVLHPAEYEEDVALSYGYPLASAHLLLDEPDEYMIETLMDCNEMIITIKALNDDPSGIRSIALLPDSSENALLEFVQPANPIDIKAQLIEGAEVRIRPINPRKNARGVLIIKDRTRESKRWRVEYTYEAEDVAFDPSDALDFGKVTVNESSGEKIVTIINPLSRDIIVKRLSFVFGNQRFTITRTLPDFQWQNGNDEVILKSGDSLQVWIEIIPNEIRAYMDSLKVELGCISVTLPVRASSVQPCISVNDLDFGTVPVGTVSRPRKLKICNVGQGTITLLDPYLTWIEQAFEVDPTELEKLKGLTLVGPTGCIEIEVRFRAPNRPGPYSTNAQVWSSSPAGTSGNCRDVSIWRANVVDTTTSVLGYEVLEGYAVSSLTPNPTSGKAVLTFKLGGNDYTTIQVFDAEGRVIATLVDGRLRAGEHRVEWDGSGYPSGTYYIRVQSGEWTGTASVLKVR